MDKLPKNMKVDLVSEEQMTPEERSKIMDSTASVDAIPDLNLLTRYVYEILQYLENPETKRVMSLNPSSVQLYLNSNYTDKVPYSIITLLLDEKNRVENVSELLKMFEQLNKAKQGKISLSEAEKTVAERINKRYLSP
jgi:hypothetical protein